MGRYILTDQEKHNVTIFGTSGKVLAFGGFGHKPTQDWFQQTQKSKIVHPRKNCFLIISSQGMGPGLVSFQMILKL